MRFFVSKYRSHWLMDWLRISYSKHAQDETEWSLIKGPASIMFFGIKLIKYQVSFGDLLNLWGFYSLTAPHYGKGSTITRIDQIFSRYARAKWFIILVRYNIFVSSWTSPYTHRQCSGKEHVEELLYFITELKSKSLPHHHMPAGSELLIQDLFNRFRTLKW